MKVLETPRLTLRWMNADDAPFILELLNDPDWIRFIGDRGIRTLEGARGYIEKGPMASYARFGFGLYLVELTAGRVPIGMCGLIKRDTLSDVDIGFAFMPQYRGQGYAHEAAAAVMELAKKTLGIPRVVAIASKDNIDSAKLLAKIGLSRWHATKLAGSDEEIALFEEEA